MKDSFFVVLGLEDGWFKHVSDPDSLRVSDPDSLRGYCPKSIYIFGTPDPKSPKDKALKDVVLAMVPSVGKSIRSPNFLLEFLTPCS